MNKQLTILALLIGVLLAPALVYKASEYTYLAQSQVAVASLSEQAARAIASDIAKAIDQVVRRIHSRIPSAQITHTDVLAIMCTENAGLNVGACENSGKGVGADGCGMAQVAANTHRSFANNRTGGFYLSADTNRLRTDLVFSIESGALIFDYYLRKYKGDRVRASIAYNAGEGRVNNPPKTTANRYLPAKKACNDAISAGKPPRSGAVWAELTRLLRGAVSGDIDLSARGWYGAIKALSSNDNSNANQPNNGFLSNFFAGKSGVGGGDAYNSNPTTGRETSSTEEVSTNDGADDGGYVSPDDDTGFVSSETTTDESPTSTAAIKDIAAIAPLLTCLPSVVLEDEPALIFWQCKDGSRSASADNFETGNSAHGSTEVNPDATKDYALYCGDGEIAAASCSIKVVNPAIAIIVNTSTVQLWDKVNVTWSSIDTQTCKLDSDDDSSKYASWSRTGTTGDVYSHAITKATTFTLTCTTETGLERSKSITVNVE